MRTPILLPSSLFLICALIFSDAGHAQDAVALPRPLVVTLDDARLKEAGIADDAPTGQAIRSAMTASGANLVLRNQALGTRLENADITDQVIAMVKGAAQSRPAAKAFAPRM